MSNEVRIERGGAKKKRQKCGGDVYIREVEGTQKVQQRVARVLNGCFDPGGWHYSRSGRCPGPLLGGVYIRGWSARLGVLGDEEELVEGGTGPADGGEAPTRQHGRRHTAGPRGQMS